MTDSTLVERRDDEIDVLNYKIAELENTVRLLRIELYESRQIARDMVKAVNELDDSEIHVGDMVETAVYVCQERRPTGIGRVVRVHSGYCDVDHCFPYAAPWIYAEITSHLRKCDKEKLS